MRRVLGTLSVGLTLAYVLPLSGYVLVRHVPADAPWWLDLANTFALYLFAPALPLLLLGLLSSSRLTVLVCLVPVTLFAFVYGGQFLSRSSPARVAGVDFTITTYNVEAGAKLDDVVQVIAQAGPDIVAVQELDPGTAAGLVDRLGSLYPYRALLPRTDYSGAGVLSRFPIKTQESFVVGHLAQHLVLEVHGRDLHLFNFHLLPPQIRWLQRRSFPLLAIRGFETRAQKEQVAAVMETVGRVTGPTVVAGDFNFGDQTRQYRQITRHLADAHREVGWGFGHTFPANGRLLELPVPLLRIDYIFHSRELTALEARVGSGAGSDHLPVIARLSLPASQ